MFDIVRYLRYIWHIRRLGIGFTSSDLSQYNDTIYCFCIFNNNGDG